MTKMTPLPSLIRASAQDAANMQMRRDGRSAWSEDDYNLACSTQERLIRACYGKPSDHNDPNRCYIRFGIAERMQRDGTFHLKSDYDAVLAEIEQIMGAA